MYGTQASATGDYGASSFENDVKMYGTQADTYCKMHEIGFENDVKMYGTQANALMALPTERLRMM